jgi:hypothetical protein
MDEQHDSAQRLSATHTVRDDASHTPHGHEANTVRMAPILVFGGTLVVLTIVVLLLMRGMFHASVSRAARSELPPSPLAVTRQPPPEPRLQVSPAQELAKIRADEDALLYSYGWVDRATGVVHIPINRAIDLLLETGLPVQPPDGSRR